MDFVKEFTSYINSLPLAVGMKKKIIQTATYMIQTEKTSSVAIDQLRDNIYTMFTEKKGMDESYYLNYLTYALNRAKESE